MFALHFRSYRAHKSFHLILYSVVFKPFGPLYIMTQHIYHTHPHTHPCIHTRIHTRTQSTHTHICTHTHTQILLYSRHCYFLFYPFDFFLMLAQPPKGFPGLSGKEPACQCRRYKRHEFSPWVGKILWRRAWQPTPVFLPGKSHGQRRLVGYSPWGESRTRLK